MISFKFKKGQGMLVAILMITAAALAIALAVATMASSEVNISQAARQSAKARMLAEGCLEDALMRLARTNNAQPPTFTSAEGNCTINIAGSAPYEITSTGQAGRAFSKIKATVSVNNEILSIEKWEEIY